MLKTEFTCAHILLQLIMAVNIDEPNVFTFVASQFDAQLWLACIEIIDVKMFIAHNCPLFACDFSVIVQ